MPVPEKDLPVRLPEDVTFDQPGNPLDRHPTWKHVACPQCGGPARRETDTMDTFVDSSWYFVRFTDPTNETAPTDPAVADHWLPVDQYIGGIEHAICICSIRASSPGRCANAATSISTSRSPGSSPRAWWCTRPTATRAGTGSRRARCGSTRADGPARVALDTGEPIEIGPVEKMSKSKRNTVDPDEIIETYGADTARWFMLSDSPPERDVIWTEAGVRAPTSRPSGCGG